MTASWAFWLGQATALATPLAIVVAALIAKRGVQEWREERLEGRQSEVAEQALILAYQAPDVFARIRSHAGFSGEGSSRQAEEGETPEQKEERDRAFVPIERIRNEARFFEEVAEIRPRIDALFGKGQSAPFNEFLKLQWEIVGAARMLSQLNGRTHFRTQQQHDEHMGKINKYEAIIWPLNEPDEFNERVISAVSSIEKFAAPTLESRFRPRKTTLGGS